MTGRPSVPRLMLVLSLDRSGQRLPPADLADAAVAGGADAVQVRMPGATAADRRAVAAAVAARVGDRAVVLVNGDAALAADLGIGLHLPERLGPGAVAEARRRLPPGRLIGRSVHTANEAAASRGADYVLAGHVFPTPSHPGKPPLGAGGLEQIAAAAYLVLAIGGIDETNAAAAIRAGAAGVAVVGAITDAADPHQAARRLRAEIDRALKERLGMATSERERTRHEPPTTATGDLSLTVNGKPMAAPAGWSVRDFLAAKGLADAMAIVERNGEIVPRATYGDTRLADGDRLEVVHAVGGG